mmetsp:Transcript_6995/g.11098  ORF Transcript_6995/g.11098 Transcript_6995/m.11098 type:complete len:286 (-) Transcript_6995:1114-1971(-)|eukprot:CAMPEP_0203760254 /NCGR_PEP_ID=MMETSP0098-20131031/13594_1 /ASSEMBLY_ACC=CAM_ASM_000208 /TAXON_ID=96639 /ORGANISM=" , Strain NY0313808BC1" /LENGTH=285 /DNA_ID=CAMNT_0050653749 /DNA_START=299 /DNA_END=1156 /DNA_ORIENTATION=-
MPKNYSQMRRSSDEEFTPSEGGEANFNDVTLEDGGRELVNQMSNWFIPRKSSVDATSVVDFEEEIYAGEAETNSKAQPRLHEKSVSFLQEEDRIDVTFENAELNLKKELYRKYIALSIACWVFLTVIQSISLICLHYWQYSPVVVAVLIMAISTLFYWTYVWRVLKLPFRRLWETPYPFAVSAAVLGSLAEHAMFLAYNEYEIGQLLIVFFLIQAFYLILVASTFRNYMSKWQKFINHRKMCFEALQYGREKENIIAMAKLRKIRQKSEDYEDTTHVHALQEDYF